MRTTSYMFIKKLKSVFKCESRIKILLVFTFSFLVNFIFIGLGTGKISAQTYPVQISAQLVPPYSGYLPDYADPSAEKLKVILKFNDFSQPQYDIKLKFEIKGNGFSLSTKTFFNPPPITLIPGQPLLLSGNDLAPYLNANNLDFIGINQSQYQQRMSLPEGYYSICIKAYDYNNSTPIQLSNEACAQAWFTLSDPPYLNLPFCGSYLTPLNPQNIIFQWTPVNQGSPLSALNTEYEFALYECRPDSTANPNQIVLSTAPIYSITTQQTFINYGITEPPLNLYMKYVWRVRAKDVTGRDLFKNQGYSQICTFTYGTVKNVLGNSIGITLSANEINHRSGECTFNKQSIYSSYLLQVRKKGTLNWFNYPNTTGYERISNLEPSTTYECRVRGEQPMAGEWSNMAEFTTYSAPNYACNTNTMPVSPNATQPLPVNKAVLGMIIQSGQFEIIATEIKSNNIPGWYRGKGYALVFGGFPVAVKWDNIFIDIDQRQQQGIIEAMTKGVEAWEHAHDLALAEETPIVFGGTIKTISIVGNQVCAMLEGNTTPSCVTLPENKNIVVVRDANGNQYEINMVPPPPTISGPKSYIPISSDTLSANANFKVVFEKSGTQKYGFDKRPENSTNQDYEFIKLNDGSSYFVPYKSVGESGTDEVVASYSISNFDANKLEFKTMSGAVIAKAPFGDQFKLTGIPDNATCVYAYYDKKKIGKLNVVSLKPISKKLVLVPVNGAAIVSTVTAQEINKVYAQANVSWSVTTAPNFTFDIGEDGLQGADANLLTKYSAEMRALRDAYQQAHSDYDKEAYYVFVVPKFNTTELRGYMVRGRALGFVANNASVKELTHELAHGAFGLEHTFPEVEKGSTENLLDYGAGVDLTKEQWEGVQNPTFKPFLSWKDSEEDGSYQGCNASTANLAYSVLQTKYNACQFSFGLTTTPNIEVSLRRGELLEYIDNVCAEALAKISVAQRIVIIKYAKQSVNNSANISTINRLITSLQNDKIDSLLNEFSKNNYELLRNIINSVNDIGSSNYTNFIKTLVNKVTTPSLSFSNRLMSLFNANDFENRIIEMGDGSKKLIRLKSAVFNASGKIEIINEECETVVTYAGTFNIPVKSLLCQEIGTKRYLNPFDLILYTDYSSIDVIHESGIAKRGEVKILPAIFLKYADDKNFTQNLKTSAVVALDVASVFASGGVALATKVSWLRRAWAITEVAGAIGNIEVNTSDLGSNPNLENVVAKYNALQAFLGIKNLGKLTFSKALNNSQLTSTIESLKQKARNEFLAVAFKYNTELSSLTLNPKAKVIIDSRDRIANVLKLSPNEINLLKAGVIQTGIVVNSKTNLVSVLWKKNVKGLLSQTDAFEFWNNTNKNYKHFIDGGLYLKYDDISGNLLFGNIITNEIYGFYEGQMNVSIINKMGGLDKIIPYLKEVHGIDGSKNIITLSNGMKLYRNTSKTTIALGSYGDGTRELLEEKLIYLKGSDFGSGSGRIQVLNIDDNIVNSNGGWSLFPQTYNFPFLNKGIQLTSEYEFAFVTQPKIINMFKLEEGKEVLTGFGKEIKYLLENNIFSVKFNGEFKSIKSIIETSSNLKDKLLGQGIYYGEMKYINVNW